MSRKPRTMKFKAAKVKASKLRIFQKVWDPIFFTSRPTANPRSDAKLDGNLDLSPNSNRLFLQGDHHDESLHHFDEVKRFCKGLDLTTITYSLGTAGTRRAAWLDDRCSCAKDDTRTHRNPLTATALYQELTTPVSGDSISFQFTSQLRTHYLAMPGFQSKRYQ